MNYAKIKNFDIANGPGVRVSLFVSGCPHHCKGCFSPETWSFNYGTEFTEETMSLLLDYLKPDYIKGLSILGGEPFAYQNRRTVFEIVKTVKEKYPEKSIWIWTGYTLKELVLEDMTRPGTDPDAYIICETELLIDVLVDGPFIQEEHDYSLKYAGSRNQRVIDMKKSIEWWKTGQDKIVLYE